MFDLGPDTRAALFRRVAEIVERYGEGLRDRPLTPTRSPEDEPPHDFGAPLAPLDAIELAATGLETGQVHTGHPRYFGLFHPAPAAIAIAADALVAAFNPQLATRSHAPWPVAIEDALLRAFGERFGYPRDEVEGTFTTGGAEANTTALLVALTETFPEVTTRGLRALDADPIVYVSSEGHPTVRRAARIAGLGSDAVRVVPADARMRMKPAALRDAIARDRAAGARPFLIVATAGTTSAGTIDPLPELAKIAERTNCFLHVDAAWGGLLALVPEGADALAGIARADSITFDAHKALATPMGAGMFLCRRRGALYRTFADRAGYMPRDASRDPYARSLQWSRRFIGLKVFLTLATAGWDGLANVLRRQLALGDRLRVQLRGSGWEVLNETPLPVICFVDRARRDARFLDAVARAVIRDGGGWLSLTRLSSGERVLRACVNNHRTTEADIDALVASLDRARTAVANFVPRRERPL